MRIIRNPSLLSLLSLAVVLALVAPALAQQFNWQQAKGTQLRVLMNTSMELDPEVSSTSTLARNWSSG